MSTKKSNIKITPKKKSAGPRGGPPSRKQPAGPRGGPPSRNQPAGPKKQKSTKPSGGAGADSVVARLQQLITEKDDKIEKLTERINTLSMENKSLQTKIENLKKAGGGPPKKKAAGGGGVDSGPGTGGAAAMLAAKLGGHVANKKMAEKKGGGGGVETGPGMKGAAAALGGLFAKKKAPPKASGGGGVSSGPSQAGAAAALGGLFAKKKAPPKSSGGGGAKKGGKGGNDFSQYNALFKKYEMMMKLGINVHGAVGRMRQDGCEKAAIAAFEKKHNAYGDEDNDDQPTAEDLGLKKKKEVPVSKGIKMKRLHWDPTNLKYVKGSIWEELDETQIRYDKKHFELHFQVRQRKPDTEEKKAQTVAAGQIITFVSKKRTQAVLIGLKNLNLDNEQLRQVLHNMDEKIMNVDTLSKLLEMAPTMDEQTEAEKKIMQEGTRRVKDYGTVEQFFFTLCDFYNLHQRLKLWMFKQNFREICDSLQLQYKTIGKACDKIRNNKNLKLLLTIMLAFGNHMNSGTRKGCTYGFDLKILTGLTGVKSFDNTRSLLMYVYEFCDRKYPAALKVLPELMDTLKSASSMEVETLKKAYQRIQDNMKEIKNLITSDEIENYDMDDRFIMVLTKFHKAATPKMKKFNMTVGNVNVSTKRVMKKYSYGSEEDPKTIESFFQIWWKFFQDLSASKEKLIALEKERQKRIAKRKRQKEKDKKKAAHAKYGNKGGPLPGGPAAKEEDGPELHKGSSLYREFQKRKKFDDKKGALHGKLRGHVKQRSIFIANGGKLEGQPQNDTMRRLSSMYQTQQDQVKAMEDARKKAAILKYNKFRLPEINNTNKRKWTATSFSPDAPFEIPDNKPMMAPVGNNARNKKPMPQRPANGHSSPTKSNGSNGFQKKKTASNGFGKKPLKIQPKQKQNANNGVPPPPSGGPPSNNNGSSYNPANGGFHYGANPIGNWQQQAQLGFGSNPNLSYQQAQQQYQPKMGVYQHQQAQQQQQNYALQNKQRYHNPYGR